MMASSSLSISGPTNCDTWLLILSTAGRVVREKSMTIRVGVIAGCWSSAGFTGAGVGDGVASSRRAMGDGKGDWAGVSVAAGRFASCKGEMGTPGCADAQPLNRAMRKMRRRRSWHTLFNCHHSLTFCLIISRRYLLISFSASCNKEFESRI